MQEFTTAMTEGGAVIQWGVVIGASLAAAIVDLRTGRIPNAITSPLLAVGLLYAGWAGGLEGLARAAGACALLALPFVLMFLFAGGGAGDAKFMGAIGAWLGLSHGAIVLLSVCVAGIILAVCKAVVLRRLKPVLASTYFSFHTFMFSLLGHKVKDHSVDESDSEYSCGLTIPYGVAIFAGVCAAGVFILLWQG
ncbi:MAG: prepilin peptidase [Sedimentisphaerales bacterium]|nr:prepilin peptidase [Sedimentisphaerales bacterium]